MAQPEFHKDFHFATISKGAIAILTEGYPPQPLESCQIELSAEEYHILRSVRGDLKLAKRLIKAIDSKIKVNGS